MKNTLKKCFILILLGTLFTTTHAEEETFLVTATKTQTEAREIGKSFTVITREEIERSNHHDLVDMLRRVPGVNVAKSGPNGTTGIFIRGNESYYTKILINGAALEDASGTQVTYANIINSISLDNVEKIEIIRGPQSVLYGSDAIGGVINIITKKGQGEFLNGSIRQEFGEGEFSKSTLNLNGADGGFNYSLSLSHEFQDGIEATTPKSSNYEKDGDAYRNNSGTLNLNYIANEFIKFGFTGSYFSANSEIDVKEYSGPAYDNENHIQNSTIRPSITFTNLLDGKLETELSFNHADHRRTSTSGYDVFSETHKYEILNTLELSDWNTLSFGVEFTEQFIDTTPTTNTRIARYKEYYAQEQLSFNDRYFLNFGGRYSDHDQFGEHWTYQIAPAVYLEETGTKIHASYGTAYRAPSPFELFEPANPAWLFTGGDESFQPEESQSFDIGFDQELFNKKIQVGATYFYVETENKIAYVSDPITDIGGYQQVGFARSNGIEFYIQYAISEDLFTKLIYTRTHTEYALESGDNQAARVPKDNASFLINWQASKKLNLDGEVHMVGNRFSDPNNTEKLNSYTLVNLSASYDLTEKFKIFAKVNKLFDEDYEEVYGYNTYGRSFFGGVEYKF